MAIMNKKAADIFDGIEDLALDSYFKNDSVKRDYLCTVEDYARQTQGGEQTTVQVKVVGADDDAPHREGEELLITLKVGKYDHYYLKSVKQLLMAITGKDNVSKADIDAAQEGKLNGSRFVVSVTRGKPNPKKEGKFYSEFEYLSLAAAGLEDDDGATAA